MPKLTSAPKRQLRTDKKIYASGPFGELYKITLDHTFLERCKQIQKTLRDAFDLANGESVEGYKKILGKYNRSAFMLIKPNVLEVGVFWEEGWEPLTDEVDRTSKEFRYKSVEKLPNVWFQDHILWKFTTHGEQISSQKWGIKNIDEEDRDLLKSEVARYQKLLDKEASS